MSHANRCCSGDTYDHHHHVVWWWLIKAFRKECLFWWMDSGGLECREVMNDNVAEIIWCEIVLFLLHGSAAPWDILLHILLLPGWVAGLVGVSSNHKLWFGGKTKLPRAICPTQRSAPSRQWPRITIIIIIISGIVAVLRKYIYY